MLPAQNARVATCASPGDERKRICCLGFAAYSLMHLTRHATYLTRTPPVGSFIVTHTYIQQSSLSAASRLVCSLPSAPMPKKLQVYHPGVANLKSPRARLDSQQGFVYQILPIYTCLMPKKLWCRYIDRGRRA
jgi:hypothetical protein